MVHLAGELANIEIGKWNEPLFAAFRRAKGERRRVLLSELLKVNGPLIKILVGQIAGIADEKTASNRRRQTRMRVPGADQIPWDDLMQAGLQGMAHALGKFDPAKGKISGYARWWILTNIQRMVRKEAIVKTPERENAIPVALIGDEEVMDRVAGHGDDPEFAPERWTSIEDLHRWEKRGTWPDGMEEVRANYLRMCAPPAPKVVYSLARPAWDVFLDVRVIFGGKGLVAPCWPLWNAWRVECAKDERPAGTRAQFLGRLAKRGVKETRKWHDGEPVRGLRYMRVAVGL